LRFVTTVVLDTTNATVDLENENDNSEVGKYISAIKNSLGPGSCWLIAHLTKMNNKGVEIEDLSPRGAGAFVGDSNATAFLIKPKDLPDKRHMWLGKRRFEATYNVIEFNSVTSSIVVESPWGQQQEIIYRYGIPMPANEDSLKEQAEEAKQREKGQKEQIKTSVADRIL